MFWRRGKPLVNAGIRTPYRAVCSLVAITALSQLPINNIVLCQTVLSDAQHEERVAVTADS